MQVELTPLVNLQDAAAAMAQPVGFQQAQQAVKASQETAKAKLAIRPSFMPIYVEYKRKVPCRTFELNTQGLNVLARDALEKLPSLNGVKVIRAITKDDQLGFTFNFRIDTNELTLHGIAGLLERWIEKYETAKAKAGLTPKPLPPAEPLKPRSPRRHVEVVTDADFDTPREIEHTKVDMSVVDAAIKAHDAQMFSGILGAAPVLDQPQDESFHDPLVASHASDIHTQDLSSGIPGRAAEDPLPVGGKTPSSAEIEAVSLFWTEPEPNQCAAQASVVSIQTESDVECIPFGYVMADGSEFETVFSGQPGGLDSELDADAEGSNDHHFEIGQWEAGPGDDDAAEQLMHSILGAQIPMVDHAQGSFEAITAESQDTGRPSQPNGPPSLPALRVANLQGQESMQQWVDGDGQIWHAWVSLDLCVDDNDTKRGPTIAVSAANLPLVDMGPMVAEDESVAGTLTTIASQQEQAQQWMNAATVQMQEAIVQTLKSSRTPMARRTDILSQAIEHLPQRYDALQSVLIDMQMSKDLARQVRMQILGMPEWATTVLQTLELSDNWHKSYLKARTLTDACSHLSTWAQPLAALDVVEQMGLFGDPKALRLQKQLAKVVENARMWAAPHGTRADSARVLAVWVDVVHQYEPQTLPVH
jgi:hypothetical protein